MLTLALAALLAVNDEAPVSPPPLVPAIPEPLPTPPPAVRAPEGVHEEQPAAEPEDEGFNPRRVAVTTGVAGATGAALVGGALWYALSSHDSNGSGPMMLVLSLPASLFLGTCLAYAAHHGMGGQGGYGAHLAGGAMGGGLALAIAVLAMTQLHDDPGVGAEAGFIIASGAVFGLATAMMGELSHIRTLADTKAAVSVIPTRGGAIASVGLGF